MITKTSLALGAALLTAGVGGAAAQTAPVDALGAIVTAPLGIIGAPLAQSEYPNRGVYEGRSVRRVPTSPDAFYNESDERGDRSGDRENPILGGD